MSNSSTLPFFSLTLSSFIFNPPATTEIYTLSLHDALPISPSGDGEVIASPSVTRHILDGSSTTTLLSPRTRVPPGDRKSTRLNSSHLGISYAVFCLKKKKKHKKTIFRIIYTT